jgi:hypothetical protein
MEFEETGSYNLNFDIIAEDTNSHSAVRILAYQLKQNPYYRIGPFLQSLKDKDLKELQEICEEQAEVGDEVYEPFESVVMLALMLAAAEGVEITDDSIFTIANIMTVMITMEALRRKGFVEVKYDKVSFGPEFAEEVVVKKTKLFDDYLKNLEDGQE